MKKITLSVLLLTFLLNFASFAKCELSENVKNKLISDSYTMEEIIPAMKRVLYIGLPDDIEESEEDNEEDKQWQLQSLLKIYKSTAPNTKYMSEQILELLEHSNSSGQSSANSFASTNLKRIKLCTEIKEILK